MFGLSKNEVVSFVKERASQGDFVVFDRKVPDIDRLDQMSFGGLVELTDMSSQMRKFSCTQDYDVYSFSDNQHTYHIGISIRREGI